MERGGNNIVGGRPPCLLRGLGTARVRRPHCAIGNKFALWKRLVLLVNARGDLHGEFDKLALVLRGTLKWDWGNATVVKRLLRPVCLGEVDCLVVRPGGGRLLEPYG